MRKGVTIMNNNDDTQDMNQGGMGQGNRGQGDGNSGGQSPAGDTPGTDDNEDVEDENET